jgi:hypothetical protein
MTRPIIHRTLRQRARAIAEIPHRARSVDVHIIVQAVLLLAIKAHRDTCGGVGALKRASARVGANTTCL